MANQPPLAGQLGSCHVGSRLTNHDWEPPQLIEAPPPEARGVSYFMMAVNASAVHESLLALFRQLHNANRVDLSFVTLVQSS